MKTGGTGYKFRESQYFIPQSEVHEVGRRIKIAQKKRSKRPILKVPDSILNKCKDSFKAAHDRQEELKGPYDIAGLMAMVCRHGHPLFLAHITTAGERQQYAVVLIERLFMLLPPTATVTVFYDIACQLDRSLNLVSTSSA